MKGTHDEKKEERDEDEQIKSSKLKKAESVSLVPKKMSREASINLPIIRKSLNLTEKKLEKEIEKQEKVEITLGRKLIDDLKNEKDWKIRLEAIEELQNKFLTNKDSG